MTIQFTSVDHALRKAKTFSKKGAHGDAQAAYRWVLTKFPDNKRALDGLQELGGRSRNEDGALGKEQANALITLHKQGRHAEALQQALALRITHPKAAFLHDLIGACHMALGQPEQAVASYQKLVALLPDNAAAITTLGDGLSALGRAGEAVDCYRKAIALNPGLAKAHNNMGNALMKLGDVLGAAHSFARAGEVEPGLVDAHANLGLALVKLGQPEEGAAACERAIAANASFPLAYINMAHALDATGQTDEAIANLEKAIALAPRHIGAHSNLCDIYDRLNRIEDMRGVVDRALKHCNPDDPRMLFRRAQLASRDKDHETARRLMEQMPETGLTPAITKGRLTLLGKTCDKLDDPAAAFEWIRRANDYVREMPSSRQWKPEAYRNEVEGIAASFSGLPEKPWRDAPASQRPAPVFLVGFPRSGTTLLDTILRSHPGIAVLEELGMVAKMRGMLGGPADRETLETLSDDAIEAMRAAYFAELDQHLDDAPEAALVVDKLPLNIVHAGLIHRVFPDAKFILSLRHPCDCVLSCYMQNFKLNNPMANFLDIESSAILYDRVMRLWTACRSVLPFEVHPLAYEDLIADMEGSVTKLLGFLGLEWDERMHDYRQTALARGRIHTPSYNQVTESLYSRAAGRWEKYREQMQPVLPLLEPWARHWGY
jgi:tetratricopeptide (TPR) repeat protein